MSRRARSPSAGWSSNRPEDTGSRRPGGSDPGRSDDGEIEAVPAGAAEVFGDQVGAVAEYARMLAGAGVVRGLIGPGEVGRLWTRHLLNSGVLAPVFEADDRVCDVGSGAGLPGVVLAIARPDVEVTLLEPALRRIRYLEEVVDTLGLTNVRLVRARAEEHRESYDWVTARAVAPLDRLLRIALPLLRPDGVLLAMKGSRAGEELRFAEGTLRRLGARSWRIEQYGIGVVEPPTTVVRVTAGGVSSGKQRREV